MGFNEGSIALDNPNSAYFAGQTVHGTLEFNQDKLKKFRGIYVKMKGYCKVRWMSSHTRRINGQSQVQHEVHESNEIYFDRKQYLVGAESGDYHINAGSHKFSFSCHIPENCPSSYKGTHGEIAYEFNVVVDRPFKPDQHKKASFTVIAPLDLNADPYCREPLSYEFEKTYGCSCISSGTCEAVVKFPVAGFVPGQSVPVEVGCTNNSNVKIRSIKFTVIELVTFHAVNRPASKHEREPLYEIKKGPIPGNTTKNWNVDFKLPIIKFYNVNSCKYIDITYIGKVTMKVSGCHSDLDQSKRIVIGTIPLTRHQEQTHNRTPMQLPQVILTQYETPTNPTDNTYRPQPPMINYPTPFSTANSPNPDVKSPSPIPNPPYPTNSPYPVVISPYPTNALNKSSNSPFSPTNPPYPNTNSPYPSVSQPYPLSNNSNPSIPLPYPSDTPSPAENSPYPTTNSPYPTTNFPCHTTNSPYPTTNSPYPTTNSSCPTKNSPYPTTNSPCHTTNSPYPTTNSPYPTTNSPYPTTNSSCPTKNSPYPTANSPYPTTNSPSPTTNSPYPTTNSPYPTTNSPCPTTNSPYPTTNSPYPTTNSPYPYSSGNNANLSNSNTKSPYTVPNPPYPTTTTPNHPFPIGQEVQRSGSGPPMPQLPILATPKIGPNPYASASAPEPSTPVSDNENIIYIPLNPPYNPEVYKS